ncbi:hypothetical protein E4U41_004732 [Claviceps citrina]|nr:hypothetical protein E4U41_004732 [Claviceps citrina]
MRHSEGGSGIERTSSTERNPDRRQSEDDEYDLAANAVSDGFRPSASTGANGPSTSASIPLRSRPDPTHVSNPPQPTASATPAPQKDADDADRPLSTSKPPRLHDSLTLQNDGLTSSRNGQSSSTSSSALINAPYSGPVEPSHPYQLYPQRTYSNATSSTEPLSSGESCAGLRGPTHPYAMYTQNPATPGDVTQQSIPVGFSGMGSGYSRQLGPDGEEAGDLIGPLGHTEELPPYTRYPDQAYAPKPGTEIEAATSVSPDVNETRNADLTVPSPARPISGAGGIGLATRNPEFSSTEDDLLNAPHRLGSIRSVPSVESYHQVNGAARDYAEKPAQGKWHRRAKKKLWGVVPYWMIFLLLSGIIILGIIMGTVIGTMVTGHRGPPRDKPIGQRPLSNDVQYLQQRPRDLPPLDTGCYALPPMEKYQVPKTCIKDPSQGPAWSCDMPFRWYSMNVTSVPEAPDTSNYALRLAPFDRKASKFIWGSQPPDIPESQRLYLVKDLGEVGRGPAWYLEVEYNKTVIVREDQLPAPPPTGTSKSTSSPPTSSTGAEKRHWGPVSSPVPGFDRARFMRKGFAAGEGDKPWICTWPNIKLQVFIFPNQSLASTKTTWSAGPMSMSTSSSASPSPTNYKEPYSKLVKFVERRPDNAPEATCTQYMILAGGRDKVLNYDENNKPIIIKINEISRAASGTTTDGFASSSSWDSLSLQQRGVDLTPCGCVSFSWSV